MYILCQLPLFSALRVFSNLLKRGARLTCCRVTDFIYASCIYLYNDMLLQALASIGEWEALRKFSNEKKSPIGYKPFALACMRQTRPGLLGDDTERYMDSYIERVCRGAFSCLFLCSRRSHKIEK